jgi:hypothetical protein
MSTRCIAGALLLVALAACGAERKADARDPRRVAASASRVAAPPAFAAEVSGEVTPDPVRGGLASGPLLYTVQLPPIADGNTNWNPASTIELFSDLGLTTQASGVCGTSDTEGDVTIANYLPEELVNLQVEFNPISPTGHKLCTPLPANRDPALVTTFGIVDYSGAGNVGSYQTNQTSTVINGKAVVSPNGSRTAKWAFAHPDGQSFTWRARVYADLRPYAGKIESPYVDAATVWSNGGTPQPTMWVISDDSVGAPFSPPGIVSAVHLSTYLDQGATQSAGDTNSTFVISTDVADPNWGSGTGTTLAATTANIGRTIYAKMQNEWVTGGVTKLGQVVAPGSNPDRAFLVTAPATVPALNTIATGGPVTYTVAPQATGAQIEIFNLGAGRNPTCQNSAVGTRVYPATAGAAPVDIGTSGTFSVTGIGLTPGSRYCYHVRNTFTTTVLLVNYPGSWSNFSNFTR